MIVKNELHNIDCLEKMQEMAEEGKTVDAIITDPPYMYLSHKLDKKFDIDTFIDLAFKVIKPDGFLVFFGRGAMFCEMGYKASKIGFNFKEEIIWDKRHNTSPFLAIARKHELIGIYNKGKGKISRVRVDKFELLEATQDFKKTLNDLKRLISLIKSSNNLEDIKNFIYDQVARIKHRVTTPDKGFFMNMDRGKHCLKSYLDGALLPSILPVERDHYKMEHPTQKPVKLLEYLVSLVSQENDTILDPFMGSGSTGLACKNLNRNFIGCEIDNEYFQIAQNRIKDG